MDESLTQIPQRQLARCRALSIAFASVTFCIGGAALLGWLLENEILKRVHPSLVTMKANTSVCLMLVALSVFLIQDRSGAKVKRRIARACAAIVALVGLLTLSQHLIGWDIGLDQLLFYESREAAGQSFPGRMGVAASLNFSFLGLALSLVDVRSNRWFRLSNISVLMVVTITLLVFLYYFYGIEVEPIALYFTIALHTVVAFLSICAAILLSRPERGVVAMLLGNSPGAIVARRMWPAFLLVIVLGWIRTIGYSAGWYSSGFATAAFVLSILLLLAGLIWWTAASLNRSDRERHLAGLALRDSEARLMALLEQLPVGVGLTDRTGRFLIRNTLLNEFVGDTIPSRDPASHERWTAWDADGNDLDPSQWPGARALRGEVAAKRDSGIFGTGVANAGDRAIGEVDANGGGFATQRAVAVAVDQRPARSVAFTARQDLTQPGTGFAGWDHR